MFSSIASRIVAPIASMLRLRGMNEPIFIPFMYSVTFSPAYASAKRRENPRQKQLGGGLVGDGAPHDYSEHYEQNP